MATIRKAITVTDQQNSWIASQVHDGRFTNDSELIRELIRREQERMEERQAVRQARVEGERNGAPQTFDFLRRSPVASARGTDAKELAAEFPPSAAA